MPQTFNCPQCGGPLNPPTDGAATMQCTFCNNTVAVPEALRAAILATQPLSVRWKALNPNVKLVVILIVVIFVLPTCLGIAGAFLGLIAGIGAPILALILGIILRR
jgi:hypothetical protein